MTTLISSKVAVALLAGVFLALVTFFSTSPQCAVVRSPNDLLRRFGGSGSPVEEKVDLVPPPAAKLIAKPESPPEVAVAEQAYDKEAAPKSPAPPPPPPRMKPICDLSDPRYDGCEMWGDARTAADTNRSTTVFFIPPPSQLAAADAATWTIPAQSRKLIRDGVVLVRSLNQSNLQDAPNCTVRRSVPAVVFAIGGVTWNYWHAFTDVFVPLFTTAREFGGEVDLLTMDTKGRGWFYSKYRRLLRAMSRYEAVDLDVDTEVRCYQHLIVGLRGHRDFDIDPDRAPNHYDMLAFRTFVREAYGLPPPSVPLPCKSGVTTSKPRAMIILRGHTRRFVNADAVVAAMEGAGFDVVRMEPSYSIDMDDLSRQVDACDVLVGAHGAGLTNMLFLRTGAVVVQVVPWGKMEPYCDGFFGAPAAHMGIRHVTYSIAAEESTLYEKYGKDSPVITDPSLLSRNSSLYDQYYWKEQNIRVNTTRFMPTLEMVKRLLQE